ncbi:MAG: aminomethyl-transferring glycine dehydrogenase [Myxococcales bacterium]|nr:aminomethyl-transferring glycine dehydrogenase [Myxococcales bacterium]
MPSPFPPTDTFVRRHLGPDEAEIAEMLKAVEASSLDQLIDQTVPRQIRAARPLQLPSARSEPELLAELEAIAEKNHLFRSFIGMGYHDTVTPPVIQRNILENPGWYTQYTPYQSEISQGRLEALLNFQTMISDLTGLEIANASLLDEGTAAAEAMAMAQALKGEERRRAFFVSESCHPQTTAVVRTRAWPLGWEVIAGDHRTFDFKTPIFGALVQYPATDGAIHDWRAFNEKVHEQGGLVVMAADPLALTLLTPPGELGADVAVGSAQRFGVPMGYGGPHAAYFATRAQFARSMPGRIIGVSEDAVGRPASRMALQTREQHIRREKATSNICTSQVLLAVMASMYAVYHGPEGLKAIAARVRALTAALAWGLSRLGHKPRHEAFFDTLRIETTPERVREIHQAAAARRMNFRNIDERGIGISLDEATSEKDLEAILVIFAGGRTVGFGTAELASQEPPPLPAALSRRSPFLTHPVFRNHHSETEMLRYIRMLEARDLSLTHSMIPLGSCTMKLNATSEMMPISWPRFSRLHPFAPVEQAAGYHLLFEQLEAQLAEITGFAAVSLQPNAGAQGEYAGLLVIRRYHESRGQSKRDVVLIPQSAHGTNPASAVMAGCQVVVVKTDERGNIDLADLRACAEAHRDRLAALMVTYPSTHGVFEEDIQEICSAVHERGGQVYLDGANMNALVGLCRPVDLGADVCHLNLHKTFCIPHGGGGPGAGPIAVAPHLVPFLPGHPLVSTGGEKAIGPVASAPYGSASILPISWAYISLMGAQGLKRASEVAILNANYLAKRLDPHYPVLYRGKQGRVAHECIVDPRALKRTCGVEVEDIAKRLMDYGFHAPTISFPVSGTMMIEPTESEPKAELDRYVEALVCIREEIREIESGAAPREGNLLKNAPHPAEVIAADEWKWPYSRRRAAYPTADTRQRKFWPAVARVNNPLGDRKLVCICPPPAP